MVGDRGIIALSITAIQHVHPSLDDYARRYILVLPSEFGRYDLALHNCRSSYVTLAEMSFWYFDSPLIGPILFEVEHSKCLYNSMGW